MRKKQNTNSAMKILTKTPQNDPTQTRTRSFHDTIARFKMINQSQKILRKDLKYNNQKQQNFTSDRKYIKQETLDTQ